MKFLEPYMMQIESLCHKYKVKELYAFGSVVDDNKFNDTSDVDLLLEIDIQDPLARGEAYWGFLEAVEDLLNRPVDLVTISSMKNKYFIKSVEKQKQSLFAA